MISLYLQQFPLEMFAELQWRGRGEERLSLSPPAPATTSQQACPDPSRHSVPEDPLPHEDHPEVPADQLQLEDGGQVQVAEDESEDVRVVRDLLQQAGSLLHSLR